VKELRKNMHKSKNIETIKLERQQKLQETNEKKQSLARQGSKSQLSLLKEILYDDQQLKNLILKSDSTLKVVQSFFNDDNESTDFGNKVFF
jgi:hypothetical protein